MKPACSSCARHELACIYDRAEKLARKEGSSLRNSPAPGSQSASPRSAGDAGGDKRRQRLELKLFYHYVSETAPSLAANEISQPFFGPAACKLALQSDAVLYSICLLSAMHEAKLKASASEDDCSEYYADLALREHHAEVANLTTANVDSACMTSTLLRVYGFIRLQDRPLTPYTPPLEWLRMTGASNVTFQQAQELAAPGSVGVKMMSTVAYFLDERRNDGNSRDLGHLLRRQQAHELVEDWGAGTSDAYKMALNCIGLAAQAESNGTLCRRLAVFPMMVDKLFLDLVEERRPRALAVMAHYFALLAKLSDFWWIGASGHREVAAIQSELPPEWQGSIRKALATLAAYPVSEAWRQTPPEQPWG